MCRAGMQTAMRGMDASAWEIRNSASLLYAALIVRMLGFRNMQQVNEWSAVNTTDLLPITLCVSMQQQGPLQTVSTLHTLPGNTPVRCAASDRDHGAGDMGFVLARGP